jgi:hypothetical protein
LTGTLSAQALRKYRHLLRQGESHRSASLQPVLGQRETAHEVPEADPRIAIRSDQQVLATAARVRGATGGRCHRAKA